MLTLYVKTGCAFCAMVLHRLDELGLQYDEKNIGDSGIADELVARGGKRQVPYLVDTDAGVEIYESADIVKHLDTHFAPKE
ncbi:glutathione S-transferase N-terminal domain-containing protein [Patescibacteria group bacterium]|nr:glutathione S-transferase N-terminal domain-containing protein [Patescibacteria group bacterium]